MAPLDLMTGSCHSLVNFSGAIEFFLSSVPFHRSVGPQFSATKAASRGCCRLSPTSADVAARPPPCSRDKGQKPEPQAGLEHRGAVRSTPPLFGPTQAVMERHSIVSSTRNPNTSKLCADDGKKTWPLTRMRRLGK